MCARRFLTIIFIMTLLVVAAAFAIFQFGNRVLIKQAVPTGHFQRPAPNGAPDYAANASWLTRPGLEWPNDPTKWKPSGAPLPASASQPAAVFYVHPTTYLDRDRWNAPLRPPGEYADFRTRLFLQSQASAFNDVGSIWAPRYRQAAFGAFLLRSDDAREALDLAYADVASAFDQFVKDSGDRPIILVGHSQGALHLERLLAEKVAGKPIAKRIVAAYVVGWPISSTSDLPKLGLPACAGPDQTGCLLSWMSFAEPANPGLILEPWEDSKGLTGGDRRQQDILCVNPITGTAGGQAAAPDNPGTLVPSSDLSSANLQPGLVGARCDKGLLLIDGAPAMGPYVLPGNNYHVYDYALFYGAIHNDAERRMAAWAR